MSQTYELMEKKVTEDRNIEVSSMDRAITLLKNWSLSDEDIYELMSLYDRHDVYGNCIDKAQNLAKTPLYYNRTGNEVLVPFNHDVMGRPMGGECSDIVEGFLFDFHVSGLADRFAELNLFPYLARGFSRDFFIRPDDNHFWTGIARRDNSYELGYDYSDMILIDPSLRIFSLATESNYKPRTIGWKNSQFERLPSSIIHTTPLLREEDKSVHYNPEADRCPIVLGISRSKQLMLGWGIAHIGVTDEGEPQFKGYVTTVTKDGYRTIHFYDPYNRKHNIVGTDNCTEDDSKEVFELLQIFETLKFAPITETIKDKYSKYFSKKVS